VASAGFHSRSYGSRIGDGGIYKSSDSGVTWTRTSATSNEWISVASSADGTKLVAVASTLLYEDIPGLSENPTIYCSFDAGSTWTRTSAPSNKWTSVASSADGAKLVAAAWLYTDGYHLGDGGIYRSSDSGTNWTRTRAPSDGWFAVTCSGDGTLLFAIGGNGVQVSTNSGVSWGAVPLPGPDSWNGAACSRDGRCLVAAGRAHIATLRSPVPVPPTAPSPQLVINRSNGNLGLSWLVPSTPFVLEQNSDFRSDGWVAMPTPPSLNFTNLNYQLTLPPTSGNAFYRLKQQ
jgi:hypothetical protein